ncbi:hypothetical protein P4S68_01860 [Pseudoalteromonas sp. Hal099]
MSKHLFNNSAKPVVFHCASVGEVTCSTH